MKRLAYSLPILIACAVQNVRADAVVAFNEIMYHPATNESAMEWVELKNMLAMDVDMSGWAIGGTINYSFPSNTIIRGRSHLVVAISPSALMAASGLNGVLGPFTSRLDNDGGTLELRNNSGRLIDEMSYQVDNDWPVAADGSGASLAKRDPDSASGASANWAASEQPGGTPGAANFVTATGFVAPPGLVSYWNFNEAGTTALDQAGQNHGTLAAGATRAAGGVGGGISFNGTAGASVSVGRGVNNNYAVSNGMTIEAVLRSTWSGAGTATIFRKAPAAPTNYNGAVLASGPVAYWRLNDGTTAIADSTPNARNGTATAGVQLNQPSLVPTDPANNAVRAGGADRIVVNGFEKISAAGYTVEYWVKPNTLPVGCCQNLVGDGEAAGDYYMMNYILGPAQGLVGAVRPHFGPGNTPVSMDSTVGLQAGSTYHVATTWDPTKASDNAVIYINGVAQRTGTITRNVPAAGTTGANRVYIGKDDRDTSDGNNTFDEVAIYNKALSADDVATHYFAGTAVNFAQDRGNGIQLAFQNDGNNALANPPVADGPVLSFGLTVAGVYSELDMPLDGQAGRPTLAQLQDGQAHHVSASYNPITGVKAIYVDGTLRFSTTLAGAFAANNIAVAVIGNSEVNGTAAFNGLLDEVAYWGKALSASEVADHSSAIQAGRDYFTPTVENSAVTLAFSEIGGGGATVTPFFIEIMNYGTNAVALGNFILRHDGVTDHTYVFPAGNLAPGALAVVTTNNLGFSPAAGDKFYLTQTSSGRVVDAVVMKNRSLARAPKITSPWAYSTSATPGAANAVSFRSEIVINEIMHSPALLPGTNGAPPRSSPEEWLELHNRSASAVDLAGWRLSGGISYLFVAGQSIPAGGYLVIANDVPYVKAKYPGATVVGDYGGRLGGSDRVALLDPSDNIADEVRYHTGQNWPVYSGGGGSSLELRDPASDNTKAEAWAASDESSKGQWVNYSYRMVANIPSGSGQPTTWQDFILGLQGAGECLIDDISVIESPTNSPVQVITNGGFENGLAGWRVLGTHNRSGIVPDPDNAANNVLRVVATGPQEHMHNHIERTLNAGRTITAGREYQISFRARWTGGNNLLNTRLYFNRVARTHALPMPALTGTPGAQNSRYVANAGPTFSNFGHTRVVPQPGEPVTVTVVAEDPQGVNTCEVFWSVNSGAWQSAAMTHQGAGIYTGSIPGQSAATVVQFYVRAVDSLGAAATYPARGTNSGALFKVNDGLGNVALTSNVRLIFTPDNINFMHGTAQGANQTNVMSNDLVPCTVIYNEQRAFYDVGAHLRGSQRGRYSDVRTGYHINFHPDELFRGTHPVMLIDRSGAGDTASNRQEEVLLKHMLNRAGGLPGTYGEICHLLAPRNAWNGAAQFFPRHEDVFVETAYGSGGEQFEMELIYYPTSANASGYKNPQPDAVVGTDMTNLGDDKEIYRYNFMLKGGREKDNYVDFIRLCKAWSLTGPALELQTKELMDIDQWMRAYAFVSLGSVGDMYTFGNNHNFFTYQRPDGKFIYFPWDMDFSFNRGETAALVGDQNLGKIVNLPVNLRLMYAHMLDIIDVCFNSGYMASWVTHYQSVSQGQNFTPRTAYIQTRANYARTTINAATGTNFTVAGTNFITTANNVVILTGNAPAVVRTIRINGVEYPITWTSISGWRIVVTVSDPTNVLNIVTYDLKGRPLPNFNRTVTVNYTGPVPNADDAVVINEIMYNPALPDSSFVEIFNSSATTSVDLSGWRINGIDYTFPAGTVITNRQYLVIASDIIGYQAAYGTNAPVPYAQYSGNLQNDGETLTLIKPGPTPGSELVIDKVRYESVPPWPTTPNGGGASLQLIDVAQNNSRVGNWSAGEGWRFASYTGTIQGGLTPGTNFYIFLNSAGEVLIDDVTLVTGTQAGVGPNILVNGDFESPLTGPWAVLGNHSNSVVTTEDSHGGSSSLRVIGGVGGISSTLRQFIPAFPANTVCTVGFWFRPTTNASQITLRTTPGSLFAAVTSVRPVLSSPGTQNTTVAPLPPFPDLWLNELEAENLAGITDNQGEREPWIEIYNSGTSTINLTGYALADNYSTLGQWAFPAGATIQPGEFKVIIADGEPGESTAGEWHTSFRLNAGQGSVALSWSPEGALRILDYLNYTNLPPGRSYGAFPDGQPFERQQFYRVTAGGTNNNAAPLIVAYINEWMAANTRTLINTNNGNRSDDWFELYNPGNTPVNLTGYFLTDNLNNKTQFAIPAGYTIPANGYLLVWADNRPSLNTNTDPALHVNFRLEEGGEAIGLFAADGTAIDTADFAAEPQFEDISEGRFPDGPNATYFLATATPAAPNTTWANRYPALTTIPDASVLGGETLAFTASATDPDLPPQTLTFSLTASAPAGAIIDPATGAFTWTPSTNQVPSTNFITVRVTDSGVPALSTSRTFKVVVGLGFRISNITRQPNGDVSFTVGAIVGKTYRIEYKDDLNQANWVQLGNDQVASSSSFNVTDNIGSNPQRFYRVLQLD